MRNKKKTLTEDARAEARAAYDAVKVAAKSDIAVLLGKYEAALRIDSKAQAAAKDTRAAANHALAALDAAITRSNVDGTIAYEAVMTKSEKKINTIAIAAVATIKDAIARAKN